MIGDAVDLLGEYCDRLLRYLRLGGIRGALMLMFSNMFFLSSAKSDPAPARTQISDWIRSTGICS